MPVVKVKNNQGKISTVEIGYHNLLFKNDLVYVNNGRIEEVKNAIYSENSCRVEINVFSKKGYSPYRYSSAYHLYKRPLKNLIKYLIVLLTKTYNEQK
jgi:hypothetical protein